jgi:hypothetical protein
LVPHTTETTQIEGVSEQGAERDILTTMGGSDRRMEKTA